MRMTVSALGIIAALLSGCAPGSGRTRIRDEASSYYLQGAGLSVRQSHPRKAEPLTGLEPGHQSVTWTRQAVLGTVNNVERSTSDMADSLRQLAAGKERLGARVNNGLFTRYAVYGANQLPWIHSALGGATTLADVALAVDDPDMELGILRITGPRLQAAMFGTMLLAAWLDFLNLASAVLQQCPFYSVERLVVDMNRVQKLIEPSMTALSSLEPERVAVAATTMPELMGQLTREFHSIREGARVATERGGQIMAAAQFVEVLTLISTMKMSLPQLPPTAPATLGVGLVMGSNGIMMGSRIVVSAEWVEMMRRLVQAGVTPSPSRALLSASTPVR